ncbi:unnamed protein product [Spirodela intermedia]|uniref:Uncharacterized protein n=1 Tax=Spirodela intermedia TaxID=51605 RepID=A0A7I8JGA4_SPIIN|nr:unnamed protein product [Spirodela intermedia]CAA6669166.1 unnamed protein product [Spirodela intermedia]
MFSPSPFRRLLRGLSRCGGASMRTENYYYYYYY